MTTSIIPDTNILEMSPTRGLQEIADSLQKELGPKPDDGLILTHSGAETTIEALRHAALMIDGDHWFLWGLMHNHTGNPGETRCAALARLTGVSHGKALRMCERFQLDPADIWVPRVKRFVDHKRSKRAHDSSPLVKKETP